MSEQDNRTELDHSGRSKTSTYNEIIVTSVKLGPPVGWLVTLVFVWMTDPWWPSTNDRTSLFPLFLIAGLPFSYVLGGVQSALGGLAIAEYHSRRGDVPLLFVLLVGILCSAGALLVFRSVWTNSNGNSLVGLLTFFVAVHVIPALACWHATKRYWTSNQ